MTATNVVALAEVAETLSDLSSDEWWDVFGFMLGVAAQFVPDEVLILAIAEAREQVDAARAHAEPPC